MKRFLTILVASALFAAAAPISANAAFGLKDLDVTFTDENGSALSQAGDHPFAVTTTLVFNTEFSGARGFDVPAEDVRNLEVV
jgi:hypothetical protein